MKEELKKTVGEYREDAEIQSFRDVSGHENQTYIIRLEDENIVCTFCTGENPRKSCLTEIQVSRAVGEKSGVPTPEVLFSSCDKEDLPPFYITRKVEGVNGQDLMEKREELNAEEWKKVTRNVGRLMAELHASFSFENAGEIIAGKNLNVKGKRSFKEYFRELMEDEIKEVESTEFSDLLPEVRDALELSLDNIEEPERNRLIHHDIRPDNMILDGTKIKALLDFEHVTSGHPLIDYAHTEVHIAEPNLYYSTDTPEGASVRQLRAELRKGYEQKLALPEKMRQQVETFKFIEHIRYMNSFESYAESVGMTAEEKQRKIKEHIQTFRRMKEKLENHEDHSFILKE